MEKPSMSKYMVIWNSKEKTDSIYIGNEGADYGKRPEMGG
jgi:hypothetical protein